MIEYIVIAIIAAILVIVIAALRMGAIAEGRWQQMPRPTVRQLRQWRRERLVIDIPNRRRS